MTSRQEVGEAGEGAAAVTMNRCKKLNAVTVDMRKAQAPPSSTRPGRDLAVRRLAAN
jgi:hypothetical protein